MKRKSTKGLAAIAAAKVARRDSDATTPLKKVVTLYLRAENYSRLQALHGRQVGKIIDELVEAYLAARSP